MRIRRITATAAITTLMGAVSVLVASPAFAETSPQIDQSTTVTVSSTDTVTVEQQFTSSSTVDGVTTTVASTSDEVATTQELQTTGETAVPSTENSSETAKEPVFVLDNQPAVQPAIVETAHISEESMQQIANTEHQYNQAVAASVSDQTIPPIQPAAAPSSPAPAQPSSGALHQFDVMLTPLVTFGSRAFFAAAQAASHVPFAAAAALTILCLLAIVPVVGTYVSRLRRAGFSYAARSDAGAFLSFVTPVKVSFAWAVSPAASSSFYGSSRHVASGY